MSPEQETRTPKLSLRTRKGIAVITFEGEDFQKPEAQRLLALLKRIAKKPSPRFIFDLSNCNYISSEGLGATARCWKWCHDDGNGKMAVVLPSEPDNEVRNLFEIIGLSRIIGSALRPSVDDAVGYLQKF